MKEIFIYILDFLFSNALSNTLCFLIPALMGVMAVVAIHAILGPLPQRATARILLLLIPLNAAIVGVFYYDYQQYSACSMAYSIKLRQEPMSGPGSDFCAEHSGDDEFAVKDAKSVMVPVHVATGGSHG